MSAIIKDLIILLFTIILSVNMRNIFVSYEMVLTGILLLTYVIVKALFSHPMIRHRRFDATIFTFVVVSIVTSTGTIHSPFFFLLYPLLFSLSLILEPVASFILSVGLILLFVFDASTMFSSQDLVPLLSLAAVTPFAIFIGQEYTKILEQKKELIILKSKNKALVEKLNDLLKKDSNLTQ